jgi:hypothetical protein
VENRSTAVSLITLLIGASASTAVYRGSFRF